LGLERESNTKQEKKKMILALLDAESKERQERGLAALLASRKLRLSTGSRIKRACKLKQQQKKQKDRPQTLPLIEGRRISRRKLRAAKSARETKQNGTRTTNKQDSCVGNKNPPLGDQIWTKRRTSRETEQRHRKIFWRRDRRSSAEKAS
jgi:hypothetical protein